MPAMILSRRVLARQVVEIVVSAPRVAARALPGQFVVLRCGEDGERIPLTIAKADPALGAVTLIFQEVGAATARLAALRAGEEITDLLGPLGKPSELAGHKKVAVIGGGVGCAIAWPQAKALFEAGASVDVIAGFRSQEQVMLTDEMSACGRYFLLTDDGSAGERGRVTDKLKSLLDAGERYDLVLAIGPLVMMKYVSLLTKEYGIPTIVSMNPVMIDGTGMCGCCRITVGGRVRFACVEGPDFDGHQVDFDEAMQRASLYKVQEAEALHRHRCRMEGMNDD